jgi:oligopeptide/dipeptide ABC transporter ATP-binding protein
MAQAVIAVQHLQTSFFTKGGEARAVNDVSYEIKKGETLGIVGESGCGKSVTSLSIMGLLDRPGRVVGGQIKFNGEDLLQLSENKMESLRGMKLAMIFQEPMTALNPVLTIGYQIDEQIVRHMGLSKVEAKARTIEMLRLVGIPAPEERYDTYPHQLSGGMRQRAMIAMAISCDPEFLIADEPTTALDVTVQAQILSLLKDLQTRFNMTMQFITHDLGVISQVADRVMVMYAGRTCEVAKTEDLFASPFHPYTKALIQSLPRRGLRQPRLPTIEGSVPSPLAQHQGCPFANRCNRAQSRCTEEMPQLREITTGHSVACHFPVEI